MLDIKLGKFNSHIASTKRTIKQNDKVIIYGFIYLAKLFIYFNLATNAIQSLSTFSSIIVNLFCKIFLTSLLFILIFPFLFSKFSSIIRLPPTSPNNSTNCTPV